MKWIKVTDELPKIPKGKHAVSVLVCEYDPIYDEDENDPTKSRKMGLYVNRFVSYGKYRDYITGLDIFGFCEMLNEGGWCPPTDQITHWMYLPEPPDYDTKYNPEKDLLEFVYKD